MRERNINLDMLDDYTYDYIIYLSRPYNEYNCVMNELKDMFSNAINLNEVLKRNGEFQMDYYEYISIWLNFK